MTTHTRTSPLARHGIAPRGLSVDEAAAYVGVSATKFREMVADGRMPPCKRIDGRTVWDRVALDAAFDRLDADAQRDAAPDDVWSRAAV